MLIRVKAEDDGIPGTRVSVATENSPSFPDATGLLLARTLHYLSPEPFLVRVLNTTPKQVQLYANQAVGFVYLVPFECVATVATPPQSSDPPSPLDPSRTSTSPLNRIPFPELGLDPTQQDQLRETLLEYEDVFATDDLDLGQTDTITHRINTGDAKPVAQRMYKLRYSWREPVKEELDSMLQKGIIRKSYSPWASPLLCVPKPNGKLRLCGDYRALNEATVSHQYALPRLDDILETLGGSKWFTSLDLAAGFWQLPLDEESKPKTAFTCMYGLFEFNVLPFGCKNAPSSFCSLMEIVLSGLNWERALAYIDDILIFTKTNFADHLADISAVFDRLRQHKLKVKVEKCSFAQKEVTYLGHTVGCQGVLPNKKKVQAITDWPTPKDQKDLRRWLATANYYRKYVENYSKIAHPLNALLGKDTKFLWTDKCATAFNTIKTKLTSAPLLRHIDFKRPFILSTDACEYGMGVVLSQEFEDGEHPVAYASRSVPKHQRKYNVTEMEAAAIVWGCYYFNTVLAGHEVTIRTDHAPLRFLKNNKHENSRLQRWAIYLSQFNLKAIEHVPGHKNAHADGLSRTPLSPEFSAPFQCETLGFPEPDIDLSYLDQVNALSRPAKRRTGVDLLTPHLPNPPLNIPKLQQEDSFFGLLIQYHKDQELPPDLSQPLQDKIKRQALNSFLHFNGTLYYFDKPDHKLNLNFLYKLALPQALRPEVLHAFHDDVFAGHLGFDKTYAKIQQRFFWPTMYGDVKHYCATCPSCLSKKGNKLMKNTELHQNPPAYLPFERVATDILGPLHQTTEGHKYIVVFIDYATKWVEAVPLKDTTASTIARAFVENVVTRFGSPVELYSDKGANYLSAILQEVCRICNTRKTNTASYAPFSPMASARDSISHWSP